MVLVTGGSGLIGSFLLLELSKRGREIRALKRKNTQIDAVRNLFKKNNALEDFNKIEWVEADLMDIPSLEETMSGIKTLYHAAAAVEFDDRKSRKIHQVNAKGTQNLVNTALDFGVSELVYFSSIAVLDPHPEEEELSEKSKWNPEWAHSEYAISKKKAEMEVWRASQEGMNVLVLYPSIVIGSLDGKRESESLFRRSLMPNAFAPMGTTGFVDVRDVAYLAVKLSEENAWNEAFLLNSEEKSYWEVFNIIRETQNLSKTKVLSPQRLKNIYYLSKISKFFGGKSLSKSSYHALTSQTKLSNEKIIKRLSFSFITVENALSHHLDYYLKVKDKTV